MHKCLAGIRNAEELHPSVVLHVSLCFMRYFRHRYIRSLTLSLNGQAMLTACVLFYKVDLKFKWGEICLGIPKGVQFGGPLNSKC